MEIIAKKNPSIIVIGDSHARGVAAEISSNLGHAFEITGSVAPGARLEHITNLADDKITSLGKRDTVIMIGGANDINKNEANLGLCHLRKFIENRRNTNILVMTAPHRYDLQESSCVNSEIMKFNRKLCKVSKSAGNVEILQLALERNDFTRHGMHLNISGKEKVAKLMGESIVQRMSKEEVTPFILKWKEEQSDPLHTETEDNPTPDVDDVTTPDQVNGSERMTISDSMDYVQHSPPVEESEKVQSVLRDSTKDADPDTLVNASAVDSSTVPRTSSRRKKTPATKGNDFLW